MWATLISLYQSSNENRKMVLREKLKAIKMTKFERVVAYLTRITNVRDELATIGDTVVPTELVRIAIQGLPKAWETFANGIIAREHLPDWERLWNDCVQNEIQKGYSMAVRDDEEENVALVAKGKKGKPKKGGIIQQRKQGKKQTEKEREKGKRLVQSQMLGMSEDGALCSYMPRKEKQGKMKECCSFSRDRLLRFSV